MTQLGAEPDEATLSFTESESPADGLAGRRQLSLDGRPAFELSFWCGTCPALFRRLEGATQTLSLEHLADRLRRGLGDLDVEVMREFGRLLPPGAYLPLLLEITPRLVRPVEPGDYFAHEQVATWGVDSFWGLPENPRTPYYRTYETAIDEATHAYEFVVPMVPPTWNDRCRVADYESLLTRTSTPTAVAVSTLDICAPATTGPNQDWYEHWVLTHFLLDGHHKLEAAAAIHRPLRLLALVSLAGSLAPAEAVERLVSIRARPAETRAGLQPS